MLFLSALISGLLQLISHLAVRLYFPQLSLVPRYVIGTVCVLLPPTFVLGWQAALPFWFCAVVSGICVALSYWTGDRINDWRDRQDALERMTLSPDDVRKLMNGIRDAKTE